MNSRPDTDRQLLFGLLALQNGLISREQLVAAFAKWTSDKSVPLDDVLIADGAIGPAVCDALHQMVRLHVQLHGGDAQKSLLSLPVSDLASAHELLSKLGDTDLHRSLGTIPNIRADNGNPAAVGRSTSTGERFRILRPLPGARGGMGEISIALDDELGRKVALKQIVADKADHEGYRRKFQVEAEITGNLEHPGIVPVYGLGTDATGRPYYAMRLVLGDNLNVRINEFHKIQGAGPFGAASPAVDYSSVEFHGLIDRLIDVAQAVRYAHSRGVLHRDLKPGNILVGEYGETLVIDWGLARLPQSDEETVEDATINTPLDGSAPLHVRSGSHVDATMQGQVLGTVGYAPPEQLDGRVHLISERSDIYALGAILYQILVGQPPVGQGNEEDLSVRIRHTVEGKIAHPQRIDRAVPKALAAICMKALRREPTDRYESVESLIDEIESWKADQPVAASPDSWVDRMLRLARRHRAAALASAAALVGIACVAGSALIFVNRARVNETAARQQAEALASEKTQLAEEKGQLAQRNQAVVDAFVDAFRSADPENEGVTSSMTATEVLEQALHRIEEDELQDDPLTKARLLNAIGLSLHALGGYDKAVAAFEMARDLYESELGPRDINTLNTIGNLAVSYQFAGRIDEGLTLAEQELELRLSEFGREHEGTLNNINTLAFAYQLAGRLEKALEHYEQACELSQSLHGDDHPSTLTAKNNLALAYHMLGRLDEAIPIYEATFATLKQKLGPDHPTTLTCMANLAMAYNGAGRTKEAIPVFEESLKRVQAKLGHEHPSTLTSMDNLAMLYDAAGRIDDAVSLAKETLRLRKKQLGVEHPDTLGSMNRLAEAYNAAGRFNEALPLAEESLDRRKTQLGPEHPDTLTSMSLLALIYQSVERLDESIAISQEVIKLRQQVLGVEHPETLRSMHRLALALQTANRLEEAVELAQTTLELFRKQLGPEHPGTLASMASLASSYVRLDRLDEGIPLFERLLELRRTHMGPEHPSTLSGMHNLAFAYESAGRLGEAIPLFEAALELRREQLGSDHPDTLDTMDNLALAYELDGRVEEAARLFETTLQTCQTKYGSDHAKTVRVVRRLLYCLAQTERFERVRQVAEHWIPAMIEQSMGVDLAETKIALAEALFETKQYAEAKTEAEAVLGLEKLSDLGRLRANNILGAILAAQESWEEAEPLLIESADSLVRQLDELNRRSRWYVSRACERVIAMYSARGKQQHVARWEATLAQVNRDIEEGRKADTAGAASDSELADEETD